MKIFVLGQCSLHWGRLEFGNVGNYYVAYSLFKNIRKRFPDSEISTTFQLSKEFCRSFDVKTLPMDLYYCWENPGLDKVIKEYQCALMGEVSEFLFSSTISKYDLIIDYSGDMWGDNAEFLGKDRLKIGILRNLICQAIGKKTCLIAGSPGPFSDEETKLLAQDAYKSFDFVSHRENISNSLLEKAGFYNKNSWSLACPAFLFDEKSNCEKIFIESKDALKVGFSICGWNFLQGPFDRWPRDDGEFDYFLDLIKSIRNNYNAQIYLISHSNGFDPTADNFELKHGRDFYILKRLYEILKLRGEDEGVLLIDKVLPAKDIRQVIGQFDFFITGRIHAAVAAYTQYIPTLVIGYGNGPEAHKVKGFSEIVGMGAYVVKPGDLDDSMKKFHLLWINKNDISGNLKKNMPKVISLAEMNFDLLVDFNLK